MHSRCHMEQVVDLRENVHAKIRASSSDGTAHLTKHGDYVCSQKIAGMLRDRYHRAPGLLLLAAFKRKAKHFRFMEADLLRSEHRCVDLGKFSMAAAFHHYVQLSPARGRHIVSAGFRGETLP